MNILINGVFYRTICLEKAASLLENENRCRLDLRYTENFLNDGKLIFKMSQIKYILVCLKQICVFRAQNIYRA